MLRITEIRLGLHEDESLIPDRIKEKAAVKALEITEYRVVKESVDARKRNSEGASLVYTVDFKCAFKNRTGDQAEDLLLKALHGKVKNLKKQEKWEYVFPEQGRKALKHRPVIVGFGPAGMMAALILVEAGYKPLILERGKPIDDRAKDVENFWQNRILSESSNVQFGEGGAGTFSDGKLTTGTHDRRIGKLLEEFAEAGADPDILYRSKPHIGTDVLRKMVVNIRKKIISLGGEVKFSSCLTDITAKEGKITEIEINGNVKMPASAVIIASGHSAGDTVRMLYERGAAMEAKPFSIGVRIEHLQKLISEAQYGEEAALDEAAMARLGPADYKLSYHCKNGRGVYTFCMCPGGYVVGATSKKGCVVTNGMSFRDRGGENANSAILVGVTPDDYGSDSPLAGLDFQEKYEKLAYKIGGENYDAPCTRVGNFLNKPDQPEGKAHKPKPTYLPGVIETDISACLPDFAAEAIREALPAFAGKIKGFDAPDAIMTGVESRSSSPVRILRGEDMQSLTISGLYPVGEGAGYAGGIVSAGVDGIKAAEKIIEQYSGFSA